MECGAGFSEQRYCLPLRFAETFSEIEKSMSKLVRRDASFFCHPFWCQLLFSLYHIKYKVYIKSRLGISGYIVGINQDVGFI